MAGAKSKKWAAESLVKETESKAIASPEQQRMAGERTAEMLLMLSPIPGGKKLLNLAKKAFKGKVKRKADKKAAKPPAKKPTLRIIKSQRDKQLSDLYNKSHPRMSKPPAKKPTLRIIKSQRDKQLSDLYNKSHPRTSGKKAKGGSVKKYAKGGGVRAARF
jgi:hypothetical protein